MIRLLGWTLTLTMAMLALAVAPGAALTGSPRADAVPAGACRAEGFEPVTRDSILRRAKAWVEDHVRYDQRGCHPTPADEAPDDEYRTDCSGFVSMAWALDRSYTTGSFARDRDGWWHGVGWDELEPGDAVVVHTGARQHIAIFVAWRGSERSEMKTYESRGGAIGTVANVRGVAALKAAGYRPVRLDALEE